MKKIFILIIALILLSGCAFNGQVYDTIMKAEDFIYYSDEPGKDNWQTPKETETRGGGDCEDTALWLYFKLKTLGYDIRFVCGKRYLESKEYHAWTELKLNGKIYILDPSWHTYSFPREQYWDNEYVEFKYLYFKEQFHFWKLKAVEEYDGDIFDKIELADKLEEEK